MPYCRGFGPWRKVVTKFGKASGERWMTAFPWDEEEAVCPCSLLNNISLCGIVSITGEQPSADYNGWAGRRNQVLPGDGIDMSKGMGGRPSTGSEQASYLTHELLRL